MNESLIQQSHAVTLPTITANPVDVYINSLSSRRSQETMKTDDISVTYEVVKYADRLLLPRESGLYCVVVDGTARYFGKSTNLRSRWITHPKKAECATEAQRGKDVLIGFWKIPAKRITECENTILHAFHFEWSRDSVDLIFSHCGMIIRIGRNRLESLEDHMKNCSDCIELWGLYSRICQARGAVNNLVDALKSFGMLETEKDITRMDRISVFGLVFGEKAEQFRERLSEAEAKHRQMTKAFEERQIETAREYQRRHTPTLSDLTRIINLYLQNVT